ncbi:MAG: glycosyltransferase family 4 protein [Bacilli bacterium]|nr:glycosyltransferase family 4 protein [Bacilli bacterium]
MKILFITQFYYPERISSTLIAESFVKQGHEVTVVTDKPNYGFHEVLPEYKDVNFEIINGVKVHRVNIYPRKKGRLSVIKNYLSYYMNAKKYVRHMKEEFDVVFSMSLSPVISIAPAILYAKKHRVPHTLFCLDLWPESTVVTGAVKENSLMYKVLYKWSVSLYKKCNQIIVSSPSFINYFNNVLHINDKKFIHVNQPALFDAGEYDPIKYEKKHNFVYAGNLGKLQLTAELAKAMEYIENEDAVLHLIGNGSEVDNIKKLIQEKHLEDKVIYHGIMKTRDVEKYYWSADALIVSLTKEGSVGKTIPNKAIQYLQYGRPILGVIQGDGKDLLTKCGGAVFANQEPMDIAHAMETIMEMDENKKAELGKLNKAYYNANLSVDKLTQDITSVLTDSKNPDKELD